MRVEEILVILQNKMTTLTEARKSAGAIGDIEQVIKIDTSITETETSIRQLTAVTLLTDMHTT
jgi:hypothetical protein